MPGASRQMSLDDFASWADAQAHPIDLTPALKTCAVLIRAAIKSCFANARAPDGTSWLPLKNPPRRRGKSPKPLRDKGILMASASAFGAGHVETITPSSLTMGTNIEYASYHQDGTATIPQRAFLGVSDEVADKCQMVIADYVEERLKK